MNNKMIIGGLGLIVIVLVIFFLSSSSTEDKSHSKLSNRHELAGVYIGIDDNPSGEKYMLVIIQNNGEIHTYYKVHPRIGDYNNWKIKNNKFCVQKRKDWTCFDYTIDRDQLNLINVDGFELNLTRIYDE